MQLTLAEEARLLSHYGASSALTAAPDRSSVSGPSTIRSEEQVITGPSEWRPYRRVRVRRVIRTEEITQVVSVRREELVVEDEPVSAVERLEVAFGLVEPPAADNIEMVLHREVVVVEKRIVPYERVRIRPAVESAPWPVETTVRKEKVDIERQQSDGAHPDS